ncbi:hypothetical protein HUK49_10310 [Limosilactobacillus sp. c11Ua_112_M]|uniref:hypothetical protein n=1 Tax=Limosilactobacillus TaxID=2742598 RepID=UPI001781FCE3|nr:MULTISPECIES: hypothetical protein [Limosilactobacillus]MBD8088255.1 hypothetical protein [Limosilactobacillus portuensis]MEC4742807.1 hypothetical protein [Limosilactobacillus sp. c10Ua_36]
MEKIDALDIPYEFDVDGSFDFEINEKPESIEWHHDDDKYSDINIEYDGFVKGLILDAFNRNSVAGKKAKEEVVDDVRKQLATAINEKALLH